MVHFYSRPCGRGDGGGARAAHGDVVISTHAPAGGATVALSANALREVFLLTPLREGRRRGGQRCEHCRCISTHAPAGGATRGTSCPCLSLCNFYSRPCGRGDVQHRCDFAQRTHISTHAPAGGATCRRRIRWSRLRDFYSRPCGRGDCYRFLQTEKVIVISTHAPAGGATLLCWM